MVHFPPEQKPFPENTVEFLKKTDSLYEGVAKASKEGIDQLASKMEKSWSELTPDMVCANLIAIVQTIADHIELKIGSSDVVFFNDPIHIRTLDPDL